MASPPAGLGSHWTLRGHIDRPSRVTHADPFPLDFFAILSFLPSLPFPGFPTSILSSLLDRPFSVPLFPREMR